MGMYYKVKKRNDAQKVKCFRNCRYFQIWKSTFLFAILLKQNIKIFQPGFSPAITILDILWIIHRMIFSSLVFFHFLISFDFLIALNFLAKYSNFQLDFDQKSILIDVGKIYVVYVVFFLFSKSLFKLFLMVTKVCEKISYITRPKKYSFCTVCSMHKLEFLMENK